MRLAYSIDGITAVGREAEHLLMRKVYGDFELVRSPWRKWSPRHGAIMVNPTIDAMSRAAVEYFRRADYLNLNCCLRNMLRNSERAERTRATDKNK